MTAIAGRTPMDAGSIAPRQPSPEDIAVAVLVQRIQSLPKESMEDFSSLALELVKCRDQETFFEITEAMREVLFPELIGKTQMGTAGNPRIGENFQKRLEYIGQKIRETRKAINLTQEQLAEKSGLPQSHISRIESGRHSPSQRTLEKIATALGSSLGQLDPSFD